jgi:3-hydroxybutyrate dehydrogenase
MTQQPIDPTIRQIAEKADAALRFLRGVGEKAVAGVCEAAAAAATATNAAIADPVAREAGQKLTDFADRLADLAESTAETVIGGAEKLLSEMHAATGFEPADAGARDAGGCPDVRPLSGKVAIVTGSTSGIGLGIARALAARGASIMFNGFGDKAEIDAIVARTAAEFGVATLFCGADVCKPDQVAAMIATAQAELGSADILVNNAGVQFTAPVEEFPIEQWDRIIGINLSSAFYGTRAALPGMKAKGWGRIVNIASAHGLVGSPTKSAYVAAKHGILGLTKVVGIEAANTGVTCNAICPGWVLTPLVEKQIADRAAKNGTTVEAERAAILGEKQPMKEFSTPEQVGELVAFLCSPHARTMTGAALSVDGGWVAE